MKYTTTILLIVSLTILSCTKKQDYPGLNHLYSELVEVWKSNDDDALKDFCQRLSIDQATADFMLKNGLCYRSIPCEFEANDVEIAEIGNSYYRNLARVRDQLRSEGLLDSLVHIDSTRYRWEVETINNIEVKGTEDEIMMRSGTVVIGYHIGEMMEVNNKWSLFTTPSVDYYLSSGNEPIPSEQPALLEDIERLIGDSL
jgi:hypothetical protein